MREYSANQRKREFGIREAMGTGNLDILSTVFQQGLRVVLTGLAGTVGHVFYGILLRRQPSRSSGLTVCACILGVTRDGRSGNRCHPR